MTFEEFTKRVIDLLKQKGYAPGKTEEELRAAVKEYDDIMKDGYRYPHGVESGIKYAANNISMCI